MFDVFELILLIVGLIFIGLATSPGLAIGIGMVAYALK